MTHTPAPWKISKLGTMGDYDLTSNNYPLGILYHSQIHDTEANAHLIEAAPELLAACQLALVELDRIGSDIGFEPDRYQERINALDALSRIIRKVGDNNG